MKKRHALKIFVIFFLLLMSIYGLAAVKTQPIKAAIARLRCSKETNLRILGDYLNKNDAIEVVKLDSESYFTHTSLTKDEIKSWKEKADILIAVKASENKIEIIAYDSDTAETLFEKKYQGALGTGEQAFEFYSKSFLNNVKSFKSQAERKLSSKDSKSEVLTGNPAPMHLIETIAEVAQLKILVLDLELNILGIPWDEREVQGVRISKNELANTTWDLLRKYNILLENFGFIPDMKSAGGQKSLGTNAVYVNTYDHWCQVVKFKDSGTLPSVEFRSGRLWLNYTKPLSVTFSPNTEAKINDEIYIYIKNQWVKKIDVPYKQETPIQSPETQALYRLYKSALKKINAENYSEAITDLKLIIEKYPSFENMDNVYFWLGEAYYNEAKYKEAIIQYERVIKNFPKSEKVPGALLKQAFAFNEIGDKMVAELILRKLIDTYPESAQSETAKLKLQNL